MWINLSLLVTHPLTKGQRYLNLFIYLLLCTIIFKNYRNNYLYSLLLIYFYFDDFL